MKVLNLINVILICLVILTGCKKKEDVQHVDKYTAQIDQLADSLVTDLMLHGKNVPLPGLIIGIWAPDMGYTYLKPKGYSSLSIKRPMQVADLFRIASVTKTYTAVMLLQLVDEGKIGLEDTIGKYLPGIPNGDKITIRQMLAMQSGLFEVNNDSIIAQEFDNDPNHYFSREELLAAIKRHEPDFQPGEKTQYSNSNFIILGILIEDLTGTPYSNALHSRITQPQDMGNTSFAESQFMPEEKTYSNGYMFDDNYEYFEVTEKFNMSVAYSAGAIISDMNELRKWIYELTSGSLVSSSLFEQMQVFSPIFQDMEYGLGIMRFRDNYLGHAGDGMGYHTFAARNPQKNITIIIFFNGEYPYPMHVFHELLKILVS